MKENQLQRCGISVVQSKNKKNKRDKYNRDRISELPEDVLAKIVCLLPLKDAVATSILSKQWRYIWTFTTNLDFDAKQTLNRLIDSKNYDKHKHETRNYIHRVNSVITRLSSKTNNNIIIIDRFRIDFDMCRKFSSFIDSWIEFAMKNRVQILELDLFESGGIRRSSDCYILRKKQFDHHPFALNSLKVLNLACVDISGKVVEWLLSNCNFLERLQVVGSTKLIKLRILGGPPNLKHLEIRRCFNMKKLEIHDAKNLVSLHSLSNSYYNLVLSNVPKLVHLLINVNLGFNGEYLRRTFTLLSSCLSQLQILQLNLSHQIYLRNVVYPTLTNLKQLKLTVNANENLNLLLSRIIPILKVSLCLQTLELTMLLGFYYDNETCEYIIEPAAWPPLKEVEILGYSGRSRNEDQLIIYLAENLVALQRIIVHPSEFENCDPAFKRIKNKETISEQEKIRDRAMQHLKRKIPTALEFEFVCD